MEGAWAHETGLAVETRSTIARLGQYVVNLDNHIDNNKTFLDQVSPPIPDAKISAQIKVKKVVEEATQGSKGSLCVFVVCIRL